MLHIRCPHCAVEIRLPEHLAGQGGACPTCRKEFRVPKANQFPTSLYVEEAAAIPLSEPIGAVATVVPSAKGSPPVLLRIILSVALLLILAVCGFFVVKIMQGKPGQSTPSGIDEAKTPYFQLEDLLKKKGVFVKKEADFEDLNLFVIQTTCGSFTVIIEENEEKAKAKKPTSRYGFAWKRYYFQNDSLDSITKLKKALD